MISLEPIRDLISDIGIANINWELIEDAFQSALITDIYNLAGVCATVAVETGCTFSPVEEEGGASYFIKNYWTNQYTRKMLGNLSPADAINYHGRGYIQLTGRFNYQAASTELGINLIGNPNLAIDPETASKVLVWFWKGHKLDKLCDSIPAASDPSHKLLIYQEVRRIVNGGLSGLTLYMDVLKNLGVI